MEGKDGSDVNTTKVWESFEGWRCVTSHHVTSGEDRDGGQGQECHCLVPWGQSFERSSKGTNRGIDVVKVRIVVYDKVFGSSAIPKATTLLIQNGRVKGHHRVQQNHWWFGENWGASWGCGCSGGVVLFGGWRRWCFSPWEWCLVERWSSGETLNTQHQPGEAVVTNTHDQSGEAEATILMIYLLIYLLRWSFKVKDIVGCTHLLVERCETQL